jgi:hypothetical protein
MPGAMSEFWLGRRREPFETFMNGRYELTGRQHCQGSYENEYEGDFLRVGETVYLRTALPTIGAAGPDF